MAEIRVESTETPPCSRCGEPLLMAATTPPGTDGPMLELCRWCDEDREGPAGGLVAAFLAGLDSESIPKVGKLLTAWYEEEMAKRGWRHIPAPRPSPN